MLPAQLDATGLALLGKPIGGSRPIGIFMGPYRLWGKARRCLAGSWEGARSRPHFAAGKYQGASD
eukprot:2507437-Pyramimonas_sp.AAC.1